MLSTSITDQTGLARVPPVLMVGTRWYVTTAGAIAILDGVRNLVLAHLLGPFVIGLCTTLMVIPQVAHYLHVGLIEALRVLVPRNRGKQNYKYLESVRNNVFNISLLISCLSFAIVTLFILVRPAEEPHVNVYVILAGLLIVLWQLKKFLVTSYIADGKIVKVSLVEFGFTLLGTLSSIVAVYYLGGYGFWLGLLIPNFVIIVYGYFDYLETVEVNFFSINFRAVGQIIPLGFVVLISSLAYTPFILASRVFLAATVGMQEVGLFLLSAIIIAKISILPGAIARVLLPQLSLLVIDHRAWPQVFSIFVKAQIFTFLISCIVILLGMLLLEPVISWVLPKFTSGIPAAKMMLLAGLPYSIIHNANNILLAMEEKFAYLKILGISSGIQFLLFAYLFFEQQVSAYRVSAVLLLVFLSYAALSNWKVIQLHRQNLGWASS